MAQSAFSFDFAADDVEKVASHPCADDREDESFVAIRASLEHGDPHFHSLETLVCFPVSAVAARSCSMF